MDDPRLPLEHPANAGILRYLRSVDRATDGVAADPQRESCSPAAVPEPHLRLGSHPDVISQFWGAIGDKLPESCAWVVYNMPVLAHPHTGVIFGYSLGMKYVLRLPPPVFQVALRTGLKRVIHFRGTPSSGQPPWTLDLGRIGPDWCFGAYRAEEAGWCLAAFDAAAEGWSTQA
ncbi:MAG TPA: hypothetical protein VFN39_08145 [Gemmatimonadaceae bacterium]|nr:hypothetical protein [Gemmatimonadaceae bacterium]